jgi:hypothetical protein
MRAKASTSVIVSTVLVEIGKFEEVVGSKAHVRSSSPQKSPALSSEELKKPVLLPFVVAVAKSSAHDEEHFVHRITFTNNATFLGI